MASRSIITEDCPRIARVQMLPARIPLLSLSTVLHQYYGVCYSTLILVSITGTNSFSASSSRPHMIGLELGFNYLPW